MAKQNDNAAVSERGKKTRVVANGPVPGAVVKRTLAHWPIAAAVMLIGALGTAEVVHLRKPSFKSETVIFYREGIQRSLINNDPGAPDPLRTLGAKLKEMLFAQANLKKIIHEYNLYADIIEKQDENAAVEQFRKKVDFKARSTDTFAISFEGASREEAQGVTSRLAETLVEETAKLKQDQAKTTTEFLDTEKKRSNDDLEKAETELAQFITEHPEFATNDANSGRVGVSVRAQQHQQGVAAAEERREASRRKAAATPGAPLPGNVAANIDPGLLAARASTQSELASAKRDLGEKQAKFTDEHPDVRAAQARLAAAETAAKQVDDQIAAATPPPAPAPQPVATAVPGPPARKPIPGETAPKVKEPQTKDEKIVAVETDWARLNREVQKARERANDLENRLFKAEMTASSELGGYSAQIAVLDPAYRPTGPSSAPNKSVVAAGFLASLILGVSLAALRGLFLDDRIFDPSEIEPLGVGPVLAIVPRTTKKRKRG